MNKKKRLVLGISIIAVLLAYMALTTGIVSRTYEVSEAVSMKQDQSDNIIIVNGTLVKGSDQWDPVTRIWTFSMTDGIASMDVFYKGDKPDVPPEAENVQVVVTGQFNDSVFVAIKKPLTKCPSKYEPSSGDILK
ncbi:MAG: cytochrome c maturation protein CcmE [Candidatus Methanoperedens sp.]|nr:cytochrome c maturation protein CcmE [Candidatus Methanoperedens sp.]MCZ7358511.1 cytochrome c maturation protein CcmE [Candidatus Methanoperedens sp.]HLB72369.1 cytochrome c maturation protein CcmE [Candidatus Methanoperedens sp.]